jgi:tetratricopeptide (TPR) repeat protein
MLIWLSLLLMLMTGAGSACLAQLTASDVRQLHNAARYTGSEEDLLKILGKNIRYPAAAQRADKMGMALFVLKISRDGKIVETGTLNKSLPEFKEAIGRAADMTKGKWAASNDTAQFFYAVFPVLFTIYGSGYTLHTAKVPDYFQGTVVVTAVGVPNAMNGLYERQESDYVTRANNLARMERHTEAIQALEELVNLQPLHTAYYEPLITLHEKIGNATEAEYYRLVRNLFVQEEK